MEVLMKKLLLLITLTITLFADVPLQIQAKCDKVLIRQSYTTCYDYKLQSAIYSAYTLDNKINITMPRLSTFYIDKTVPSAYRASNSLYTGTGYDKGHLFPASHGDWSEQSRIETNLLSNIVPQNPHLNREGAWRDTEVAEERLVKQYGTIFVVSGAYYDGKKLSNGLNIPQSLYKIIVVPGASKMAVIVYPNAEIRTYKLSRLMYDSKTIESLTGIKFNLPAYKYFTETELSKFIKQ